jgi:gamma-glutamyltranspeptidase / glutathione hydrolase
MQSRICGKPLGIALAVALLAAPAQAQNQAPEQPSGWTDKNAVASRHFMVAAANPLATEAGYRILRQGGSAVDAAVAMQMVLNLVEPQSSGIGGGAFIMHYDAKHKKLVAYDGRETAPAAATPERFLGADGKPVKFMDAVVGGKSVGVPGNLRVLELAHRQHGKLKWAALFEPAIRLAEEGFAVPQRMGAALAREQYLKRQDSARNYFYHGDGTPLKAGERVRNPQYAAVLKRIAAGGARAFYEGQVAQDIVAAVANAPDNPGDLTLADLAGYQAKVREPVCGFYRGDKVCGMPPPSSGGITVLEMLGMLEHFDMSAASYTRPSGRLMSVHLFAEAGKLAFADRGLYIADPDFVNVPVAALLDPAYLAERAQLIRRDAAMDRGVPGTPPELRKIALGENEPLELPSTSHIVVIDKAGNALSMTTTVEDGFGSRLMVDGFLLNNQLTDFSLAPVEDGKPVANRVEAGKRPRSSMAPVIVFDRQGRVKMLIGSPGGSAIINYVAKTLVGVLDWDLNVQDAIALPNFGSRNLGGVTELEKSTSAALLEPDLTVLGHKIRVLDFNSGLQGIQRTPEGWLGGADPRREGIVKGD